MNKCPKGYIKIGGICVPKAPIIERDNFYVSMFSSTSDDGGTNYLPPNPYDDLQPDNVVDEPDQTADLIDNTFTDRDRYGRYTISPDGVVILEYDDGSVARYPPDMYADLLSDTNIQFSERLTPLLREWITPDIAQEIGDAMTYIGEQNQIADTGQDAMRFDGMPSGNTFYYLDENGVQQTGEWAILRGEGRNGGTVYLTVNGQTTTYRPDQYDDLLTDNRLFSSDLMNEISVYMPTDPDEPSRDEPATRNPVNPNNENEIIRDDDPPPLPTPYAEYQVIPSFTYRSGGASYLGTAHMYDDRIVIFDSDGHQIADEPITYNYPDNPNRYSVSYGGETIVYNQAGRIKDIPNTPSNSTDLTGEL